MTEVLIDGEPVIFEGGPPGSLSRLRRLLEDALATNGRAIASVSADGRDVGDFDDAAPLAGIARVEVTSLPMGEVVRRLAAEAWRELDDARAGLERVAADVLRAPWTSAGPACIETAKATGHALEKVAALIPCLEPRESSEMLNLAAGRLAEAIGPWLDAVEKQDAATVCLQADRTLIPAVVWLASATRLAGGEQP